MSEKHSDFEAEECNVNSKQESSYFIPCEIHYNLYKELLTSTNNKTFLMNDPKVCVFCKYNHRFTLSTNHL